MGFALRQGYPPMVGRFVLKPPMNRTGGALRTTHPTVVVRPCATAPLPQERGWIRVEYETYVPPLSGGAVETGRIIGSEGIAPICGTVMQTGIASPSVTVAVSVCGTRNSSIWMVRCLHEFSVSGSEQSWQCSPHPSGSVSQKQMFAVPFRQNATESSDTARTAASPTFLNVRNMPIAKKCITTRFPLSNHTGTILGQARDSKLRGARRHQSLRPRNLESLKETQKPKNQKP